MSNKKTPDKELDELEDSIKGILGTKISPTGADVDDELSSLEDTVMGALTELTDLENNLLSIIAPSGHISPDSNYLVAVRRFQNAMKIALLDGAAKRDIAVFDEAFNFYNNAIDIIQATGNMGEIDQVKSEFAQELIKISTDPNNADDPDFTPLAFKACKTLAEIYDSFDQYTTGLEFHNRAGNLQENSLIAHVEYFQVALDYLLLNEIEKAKKYASMLQLKNFQSMANDIIQATSDSNANTVEQVKTKIEVLAAQRRLDVKNLVFLTDLIKRAIKGETEPSAIETIMVPQGAVPLSTEKINAIKTSLTRGIQQIASAHPNLQVPITAQIDTTEIVSELKEAISYEISKEIKSLSKDIVTKILSSLPTGGMSSSPIRSAGHISDEGTPDIEVVAGGAPDGEKPKRPKLDDMLDSVIVSE